MRGNRHLTGNTYRGPSERTFRRASLTGALTFRRSGERERVGGFRKREPCSLPPPPIPPLCGEISRALLLHLLATRVCTLSPDYSFFRPVSIVARARARADRATAKVEESLYPGDAARANFPDATMKTVGSSHAYLPIVNFPSLIRRRVRLVTIPYSSCSNPQRTAVRTSERQERWKSTRVQILIRLLDKLSAKISTVTAYFIVSLPLRNRLRHASLLVIKLNANIYRKSFKCSSRESRLKCSKLRIVAQYCILRRQLASQIGYRARGIWEPVSRFKRIIVNATWTLPVYTVRAPR